MGSLYENIREACNRNNISPSAMCLELGMSKSTMSDLKSGRKKSLSTETLSKIANFLNVSSDFLLTGEESPVITCQDCGLIYNQDDAEEIARHKLRHGKWEAAVKKFGFCWPSDYREMRKADARNKIDAGDLSDAEYIDAQEDVFRALFSRSLEASGYNLHHVDFQTYIAMLLHQNHWKNSINIVVYDKMVEKYGSKPGIEESQTYYNVAETKKREPKLPLNCVPIDFQKQHAVPILGRVACGVPMYADENIEGYTYTELNGGAEYFALRAKGDSMNAARIHDGDIVVIRKQSIVDDGDIAVVLVDDENATMKRFYHAGSMVTLMPQSTNPEHKPQVYDLHKTRIEVLGKVKEVKVIFP